MPKVKSKGNKIPVRNLYEACQKVLNESLASVLQVPLDKLSDAGNLAVAEYLSKEIKSYSFKKHSNKTQNEGKTNGNRFSPFFQRTFNLDDIEIHEMKPKKISYECEKCDYSTCFFCSYQIHLDNCTNRDNVNISQNGIVLKNVISLSEEVKAILYDGITDIDDESFESLKDLNKCSENGNGKDSGSDSDCQIIEDEILDTFSETFNINTSNEIKHDSPDNLINNNQESESVQINISDILIKEECIYKDYEIIEENREISEQFIEGEIKQEYLEEINEPCVIENQFNENGYITDEIIQDYVTEEIVDYEDSNNLCKNTEINRLTGRHFPDYLSSENNDDFKKDYCIVCFSKTNSKKLKIRKKTKYYCKICDVSLCAVPCFGIYHTEESF